MNIGTAPDFCEVIGNFAIEQSQAGQNWSLELFFLKWPIVSKEYEEAFVGSFVNVYSRLL